MTDFLFFFIFPKLFAGFYAGVMCAIYYRMRKRNLVDPWIYLALLAAGYLIAYSWSQGWFAWTQLTMFILCTIGMHIAQRISLRKMRNKAKQWDVQRNHIDECIHRIDEAHTWWERGDITDTQFETTLQEIQQGREKQRVQEQMIMR